MGFGLQHRQAGFVSDHARIALRHGVSTHGFGRAVHSALRCRMVSVKRRFGAVNPTRGQSGNRFPLCRFTQLQAVVSAARRGGDARFASADGTVRRKPKAGGFGLQCRRAALRCRAFDKRESRCMQGSGESHDLHGTALRRRTNGFRRPRSRGSGTRCLRASGRAELARSGVLRFFSGRMALGFRPGWRMAWRSGSRSSLRRWRDGCTVVAHHARSGFGQGGQRSSATAGGGGGSPEAFSSEGVGKRRRNKR